MTARPPTPGSAEARALRIVFFGAPRSGKTSLLEAFERICSAEAETAPVPLRLAGGAGVVLQKRLVDLPDFDAIAGAVLLFDCDGEASRALLNQPEELARNRARSELADAIRNAEALVLVVEARSTEADIETHFLAFQDFLSSLRTGRTFDREVGGWPIFLTLTKCDKLHEPGMPADEWLNRVDREMERLESRFLEQFDDAVETPANPLGFGGLRLTTEATATALPEELRLPAYNLGDGTHNLDAFVPDVLRAAADYRARARAARRRLKWTAAGVVALFAIMLALMLALFAVGERSPLEKLTQRAAALEAQREPAASYLAEKAIVRRRLELEQIQRDREFDRLPPHSQRFIEARLREIDAYTAYKSEFAAPQFAPADVRTTGMFQRLQTDLETGLAPPPEFAQAWGDTEAVRLRQKWRDDLRLLGESEDRVQAWYRRLIAEATDLIVRSERPEWRAQIARLQRDAAEPDFLPRGVSLSAGASIPVPGSTRLPIPRGEPLTFGDVVRYERADFARRDWEQAERRLLDLRDLADALGLSADPDAAPGPALLALPEPNGRAAESRGLAGRLLETLKKRFPRAAEGSATWRTDAYPEPLQRELSRRMRLAAETGIRHVRFLLETELQLENGRVDNPEDWRKLIDPETGALLRVDFKSWGRLLQLLLSWSEPGRVEVDPIAQLTEFLKADKFAIPISSIELYLPNSLRVQVLAPDGGLRLTVTPSAGEPRVLVLKLSGEVKSDANGTTYRFVPAIPLTPLIYKPGDGFTAELMLKAGPAKYAMLWTRSRTNAFAFEKLFLDPDLERLQPAEKPQRTSGVRLKLLPETPGGIIPELLPTTTGIN